MMGPYFWLVLLVEIAVTACSQVYVQQGNLSEGIVDLTSEDPIVLSWDSSGFGVKVTHVAVKLHILGSSDQDPMSVNGVTLQFIEKADNTSIYGSDIDTIPGLANIEFSYAAFSVWPHIKSLCGKFYRGGSALIGKVYGLVKCSRSNEGSTCTMYEDILQNNVPSDVESCPCRTNETKLKDNFVESNFAIGFYHRDASCCFRSATPTATGSGQQCCYDADGELLVGPRSGGTADRYSPDFSSSKHVEYDVCPWFGCCYWSEVDADCDKYYDSRPSDDCL